MVQTAWTFINDSYSTTICLEWEPEIIAIALMYLWSKMKKFDLNLWVTNKEHVKDNWWDQFVEELSSENLEGNLKKTETKLAAKFNISLFAFPFPIKTFATRCLICMRIKCNV